MPQDPAVIQRQIEQTRAELAETIDAIAEAVSPKRVAERANEQVREKVTQLRQRLLPSGSGPFGSGGSGGAGQPAIAAAPTTDADGPPVVTAPLAAGEGSTEIVRTVRWDRVALASAAFLLVAGLRRRRRRRR
ncbi:Protein of unknown function (DUF3618) [Frankia sp. EI5c]|uniref:DUF3618 domain-containing protein n=1 Tax=Frankia sp. EI5c TaxID=683316 RepID=UPI0007C3274C|nr:DUF3618 domain-containing protein [Frankia sp. EI5c]OAA26022.1 Protein of unknown function (DUF3618) [Frankia sp. EI5c]